MTVYMTAFMTKHAFLSTIAAVTLMSCSALSSVLAADPDIEALHDTWAEVRFTVKPKAQPDAYSTLDARAAKLLAKDPGNVELLTWAGIIRSSHAGAKGGLGALKLAKQSRQLFERAMKKDPDALEGGARTSLGVLYAKVPPWPLAFGNKTLAEDMLRESAQRFPDNISTVYFLAEYLDEAGETEEALSLYQQALAIDPSQDNALETEGFHNLIQERLQILSASN